MFFKHTKNVLDIVKLMPHDMRSLETLFEVIHESDAIPPLHRHIVAMIQLLFNSDF